MSSNVVKAVSRTVVAAVNAWRRKKKKKKEGVRVLNSSNAVLHRFVQARERGVSIRRGARFTLACFRDRNVYDIIDPVVRHRSLTASAF